jgi:hypothetical protein
MLQPGEPNPSPASLSPSRGSAGDFSSFEDFSAWIDRSLARMVETHRRFRTPHSELAAMISEALARR